MGPDYDYIDEYWNQWEARQASYEALQQAKKLELKIQKKIGQKPKRFRTNFLPRHPKGGGFLSLSE